MTNRIDPWSLRSVPLTVLANGQALAEATGCFWQDGSKVFLITNWHVFTGRHPTTKCANSLWEPEEITYPRLIRGESYDEVWQHRLRLIDHNGEPLWLQHPVHGPGVDVAAIEVPVELEIGTIRGRRTSYISSIGGDTPRSSWFGARLEMGEDLFVLGFPLGLRPTGNLPIWKRASVATEMDALLEGKPAFLIDTATREGMSGAPVVHIRKSGITPTGGITTITRSVSFVGIYSGRHVGKTEVEAQLGIVWREENIKAILAGNRRGILNYADL